MNKKHISFVIILISAISIFWTFPQAKHYIKSTFYTLTSYPTSLHKGLIRANLIIKMLALLLYVSTIIASIYLFQFKNWARKLFIYTSSIQILSWLLLSILPKTMPNHIVANSIWGWITFVVIHLGLFVFLLPVKVIDNQFGWYLCIILPILFIYYLTRPKVRELFK